jgi:hypothetical protein
MTPPHLGMLLFDLSRMLGAERIRAPRRYALAYEVESERSRASTSAVATAWSELGF